MQLLLEEAGVGDASLDYGRVLEVKIIYRLGQGEGPGLPFDHRMPSGFAAGYVFRKPYVDVDVKMGASHTTNNNGRVKSSEHQQHTSTAVCAYTLGGTSGPLRDVDGVRSWLPCLDSPDQRAVYDITIHAPSHFQILTCGKKIATSLTSTPPSQKIDAVNANVGMHRPPSTTAAGIPSARGSYFAAAIASASSSSSNTSKGTVPVHLQPLEHCFHAPHSHAHKDKDKVSTGVATLVPREIITSRFFTVTRLPAMSVGFFIGHVEKYKMPLYKAVGRFWVALDLNDTNFPVGISANVVNSEGCSPDTHFGAEINTMGQRLSSTSPASVIIITGPARKASVSLGMSSAAQSLAVPSSSSASSSSSSSATFSSSSAPGVHGGIPMAVGLGPQSHQFIGTGTIGGFEAVRTCSIDKTTDASDGGGRLRANSTGSIDDDGTDAESSKVTKKIKINDGEFAMPALPSSFPRPVGTLSGAKRSHNAAAAAAAGATSSNVNVNAANRSSTSTTTTTRMVTAERRLLYEDRVRHSTLGFDLSVRHLHKFVGHRLDHDLYTQIYVHDLEADNGEGRGFCAFDGFALVDASLVLHSEEQIYAETAAHTIQLTAYLYSWLKSALPIDSYEAEFILHGAVGYLVSFYVEHIYGEEDSKYRYQKLLDTVLELEKAGKGRPLASCYPEPYDVFAPHFRQYLICKSTVLFHLLENMIGGKDPMRIAFRQIMKSPLLYNPVHSSRGWPGADGATPAGGADAVNNAWVFGLPPPTPGGSTGYHSDPSTPQNYDSYPGSGSVYGYGSQGYGYSPRPAPSPFIPPSPHVVAPSPYGLVPPSPYFPPQSPYYHIGSSSGNPYLMPPQSPFVSSTPTLYSIAGMPIGSMTASGRRDSVTDQDDFFTGGGSGGRSSAAAFVQSMSSAKQQHAPVATTGPNGLQSFSSAVAGVAIGAGGFPIPTPMSLMRQSSINSELGWERDLSVLACDCLSAQSFIAVLRAASGASAELSTKFLDKYVYDSGALFLKLSLYVDSPKGSESSIKMRMIHVSLEQLCCRQGQVSKEHGIREDVKLRIAEVRDDVIKEPTLTTSEKKETYAQQVHTRPGRRGGKRIGKRMRREMEGQKLLEEQRQGPTAEELAEQARADREREALRDSIQVSRDLDYPVRYALLDPLGTSLAEVHSAIPDCLLIEQLFTEIDGLDVLRQIQALRSLARVSLHAATNVLPSPVLSPGLAAAAAATAGSGGAAAGEARTVDPLEKFHGKCLPLQLKAFAECLLGVSNTSQLAFERSGLITGPHNSFVRSEAAFCLATWQNEHAPRSGSGTGGHVGTATASKSATEYLAAAAVSSLYVHVFFSTTAAGVAVGGTGAGGKGATSASSSSSSGVAKGGSGGGILHGSSKATSGPWDGLYILLAALHDLFVDPRTGLPYTNDFNNEASTQLRTALLLALSTVRTHGGITPIEVIRALLLFAENNINPAQEVADSAAEEAAQTVTISTGKSKSITFAQKTPAGQVYDDSHYLAALLLALSRIRIDPHSHAIITSIAGAGVGSHGSIGSSSSSSHEGHNVRFPFDFMPSKSQREEGNGDVDVGALTGLEQLQRIARVAKSYLQKDLLYARGRARIGRDRDYAAVQSSFASISISAPPTGTGPGQPQPSSSSMFVGGYEAPRLPCGGVVVAAALACLAEMDVQAVFSGLTVKLPLPPLSAPPPGFAGTSASSTLFNTMPPGRGDISEIDYADFFLPARECLQHQQVQPKATTGQPEREVAAVPRPLSQLNSPAVREQALEAFVRISLAQYLAVMDAKLKAGEAQKQAQTQSQSSSSSSNIQSTKNKAAIALKLADISGFVAVALDAVAVVLRADPHRGVRRHASLALLHAVQHAPLGKPAMAAYSLGEPWLCAGWADTEALTAPHPAGISSAVVAAKTGAQQLATHSLAGRKAVASMLKMGISTSAQGQPMRLALKQLWKALRVTCSGDQATRSTLLTTWLYLFHPKVPKCLQLAQPAAAGAAASLNISTSGLESDDPFFEDFDVNENNSSMTEGRESSAAAAASATHDDDVMLLGPMWAKRVAIRTAFECTLPVELGMRFGPHFHPHVHAHHPSPQKGVAGGAAGGGAGTMGALRLNVSSSTLAKPTAVASNIAITSSTGASAPTAFKISLK